MTTRTLCLGPDVRWTMAALHLIGRPVSALEWGNLLALRNAGWSVEEAVEAVR